MFSETERKRKTVSALWVTGNTVRIRLVYLSEDRNLIGLNSAKYMRIYFGTLAFSDKKKWKPNMLL